MTFLAKEQSAEDGQPIELYRFSNLEDLFLFTSGQNEVVFGAETYIPTAISSTGVSKENINTRATLVVKMPNTVAFAQRYVVGLPASPDQVVVYRQHSTDGGTPETIIMFSGQVENVGFTGNEAKINLISSVNRLSKPIPRQTMRSACNHVLYDDRCGVAEQNFRIASTVTAISADGLTVTVNGGTNTVLDTGLQMSAQISADASYFDAGVLTRSDLEQRSILKTTDLGSNIVEYEVNIGFQNLSIGDAINVLAGCDHSFTECRTKFANEQKFGGFPYVPKKNPFSVGVDK